MAYSAALAQEQYDHRAKQKGRKSCLTPELKKEIEDGLKILLVAWTDLWPLSAWTKANGSF